MALELIAGAAFGALYDRVSRAVDKKVAFKGRLRVMKRTLESLRGQAGLIQEIRELNEELSLSNDVIDDLEEQMEQGTQLIGGLSSLGICSYCCTSGAAELLDDLNRRLERLLESLRLQQARDVKEILKGSRQNRDDLDELKQMMKKLLSIQGDSVESPASETTTENEGNGEEQVASLEGGVAAAFLALFGIVLEVKDKNVMYRPLLGSIKSTLDCLKPLIEDMAQGNRVLDRPVKELEYFRMHMEKGAELVRKCSKNGVCAKYKKKKYTNQLLELDACLQRQLDVLTVQVASDVRKTSASIRSIQKMIKRIEESGVKKNQMEMNGLCEVVEASSPDEQNEGLVEPSSPDEQNEGLVEPSSPVEQNECLVSVGKMEASAIRVEGSGEVQEKSEIPNWFEVPEPPLFTVGLDVPLKEIKLKLLEDGLTTISVWGVGGVGKTTLAKMLCHDQEVKDNFKEIFFTTASKWKNLNQKKERKPCLLVLDDIGDGSESILPEFDGLKTPNSKILITSRYAFPGVGSQYHLKSLNDEDAMSLFHHSASLGDRCSYIPEDLSRKIVECCKGLPLAITVNGRSLCGQPIEIWQKRIVEWGRGSSIFDTEPEMIVCLQRSFDALHREKTIIRECLFDLASFPEDQIIPAAALIDMWAELYGLDEEFWSIANLQKLTICGLVNIVSRKEEMEVDGYYSDLFVTLHHMLRGLAIHEASEDTIEQRNRLIIDIHGDNLPSWWTEQKYQPKNARLLSVSTDRAFSRKWQYMQVPKVEVLVLNFQTEKYELPDFLDKIDKLKVLIVTNYGSSPAQLSNLQLLGSLRNLKRIRLEGVSITSITKTPIQLDSLKKIAFTKCDMGQAFSNSSFQFSVAFPNLVEMYVEHCHDLKELPADLGNLSHLETLSISNCHSLSTLPEGIGNLSKLKRLRVRYGTNLVKFPGSIRKLNSLEFLDISGCIKIMGFPEDIGEMSRLRKLNISGCSRLKELPLSVLSLEQLQEVIMDEETENSWNPFLLKNIDTRVVPAIRDGKETLTTVKTANLQKVVSRVEERVLNIEAAIKQIQLKAKIEAWCAVPELPTPTVGLDGPLNELKMKLFNNGESMVVLTAAGGCGKTTLATKFCQDEQVQDKFKNNIFFVTVSKTRNFHQIVQELYRSKGNKAPTFKDDENALKWLQKFLREEGQNPLLLVLDDVWSGSDSLLAKFEFEMQDYKVLVTSRSEFPRYGSYALQSLDFDNAMELFRHAASLGERSLHIPPDISRQVVEGCKGFPLAITVAGKSLCGQPIEIWQERLIKWSEHSSILDSETELLLRLQTSLDVLNKEMRMVKECFLDLGSFPEDQRIPVAALIDIWTESYGSLDQDILCVANLHQVTNRSLANLVVTRKDQLQGDGYYSEHFVTQHDLLRELAIYETRQEDPGHRERLIINISKDNFPKWWSEQKYQCMKARLLSISTDGDFSTKWHDMELPVAEILVLNFQTKNYALPQFVEKMVKLKVLVVTNYGIVPSELTNFEILCTSSNLKRMRLERISIPSIAKHPMQLNSLQKISLFMCNIGQAFSNGSIQFSHAWPNLVEVNIDYCNDLVALPADTSDLIHLKKLSITNCHKLLALPEDIGKLAELELLRLRSCTGLAKLPGSTGKLKKLKSLDISYCFSIRELPEDFGELSSLRELNMRDCSRLQELPLSVSNLEHLKVIGDDETQSLWQPFLPIKGTNIVVAKENINLNWLPKFQF